MTPEQQAINDREWHTDQNWSRLGVYASPADSRTWVPKRTPSLGWTINVSRAAGRLWLLALLGAPLVIVAFAIWLGTSAARPVALTPLPLVLVVVSLPLAFGLVPRNRLYGFRVPSTMASDAVWYRANRIFAVALIAAGIIWLLLQVLVPAVFPAHRAASRWADGVGWGAMGAAFLLAVRAYRRPAA